MNKDNIKVGAQFGELRIIATGDDAVMMWKHVNTAAILYENEEDAELKAILGACFDDDYEELCADQRAMGVGLRRYQDSLKETA